MPYTEDHDFAKELEGIDKIWRYISFTKYADLLKRKKQFFASGIKLQEMDPYEGHFQKAVFLHSKRVDEIDKQWLEQKDTRERYEDPKSVFINCWHINQEQSDAMWKIYTKEEAGIAIQTTFDKLKRSFRDHIQRVYARKVKYVDNKKRDTSISWIQHRFSRKGKSFSHENELRFFVEWTSENMRCVATEDGKNWGWDVVPQDQIIPIETTKDGIYVNVNLSDFIEKVYVSPFADEWFLDLIKDITAKYELNPNIIEKSDLYTKPSV